MAKTSKMCNIPCVLIVATMTLIAAPNSSFSACPAVREAAGQVVTEADRTAADSVMIYTDGGVVFGPTDANDRFYIREVPATSFRLDARHRGFALDEVEVSPREIQNLIDAGGDVLRSLQTLPSVAVTDDFSPQLCIRGVGPEANAVLADGVRVFMPYRIPGALSTLGPSSTEATNPIDISPERQNEYLHRVVKISTDELSRNLPRRLFYLDVQITKVDRRDPRHRPVLPNDYYRNIGPDFNMDLSTMSVEESERKHTPSPYTDKGSHLCRDLLGYSGLKGILKNDILAAGATYLLAEGFEQIEPKIDKKVRGPNHYDPLYAAAGYTFHILQERGLLPHNLWWSIIFSTDDKPFDNHEHKPMQAELHCTFTNKRFSLDFIAFYNNYGYDPTIKYPVRVRVSSLSNSKTKT